MNRELKFRAWDGVFMRIFDFSVIDNGSLYLGISSSTKTNGSGWADMSELDIMQYTGLKDKNGVECFESDIIEYDNGTRAKVIFKDGCFCGYDGDATSSDEAYLSLCADDTPFDGKEFEFEVIGNIYENPELL